MLFLSKLSTKYQKIEVNSITWIQIVYFAVYVQQGGVAVLVHFPGTTQSEHRPGHGAHRRVIAVYRHGEPRYAYRDVGQHYLSVEVVDAWGRSREQFPPDRCHPSARHRILEAPSLEPFELGQCHFQT